MKTEELFTSTIMTPPKIGTENCLPVGTRLSDFEISGIVGEGGFGIVYVAFDHSLQRTVAIKEYMPATMAGRLTDESALFLRSKRHEETFKAGLRSFINEARLLAQFDHPSLIKVYRFWEENKTAYMAMRYYEGQTLKNIVKESPKTVTEAWLRFIFKQILEALDALYKKKILHRDVSPDNMIIQKNGAAVLLDFGAARQIIGDMTQGLTVVLKPGYAPVEQYADDSSMSQGPWTDIYALAAVMYFAIIGEAPPTSVARMIKDPLEPLQSGSHPGFSQKFLAAIDKGLSVQPEDRPQTIDEFRKMLGIGTFVSAQAPGMGGASRTSSARRNGSGSRDSSGPETVSRPRTAGQEGRKRNRLNSEPMPSEGLVAGKRGMSKVLVGGVISILIAGGIAVYFLSSGIPAAVKIEPDIAFKATGPGKEKLKQIPVQTEIKMPTSAQVGSKTVPLTQKEIGLTPLALPPDQTALTVSADSAKQRDPVPVSVLVRLVVKPWGTIFVDDAQKGISPPLKKLTLSEGKHKIKISNPNFPDYVSEIDIGKKKNMSIEYDFSLAKK